MLSSSYEHRQSFCAETSMVICGLRFSVCASTATVLYARRCQVWAKSVKMKEWESRCRVIRQPHEGIKREIKLTHHTFPGIRTWTYAAEKGLEASSGVCTALLKMSAAIANTVRG